MSSLKNSMELNFFKKGEEKALISPKFLDTTEDLLVENSDDDLSSSSKKNQNNTNQLVFFPNSEDQEEQQTHNRFEKRRLIDLSESENLVEEFELNSMVIKEQGQYTDFDTIDWIRDAKLDRELRSVYKSKKDKNWLSYFKNVFYSSQAWILIILIGMIVAGVADGIDIAVQWLSDIRFGYCKLGFWLDSRMCCFNDFVGDNDEKFCSNWITWDQTLNSTNSVSSFLANYTFYCIFGVAFATISATLVKYYSRWSAGSGIPETKTILGGFVMKPFTSFRTLIIKIFGLILSVSSGLNLGKEGPLVHVGMCAAEFVSKLFTKYRSNQSKKRELFSAGAAAGVSVAFGAPVGGVLFSLEEVSYYFPHKTMWRSFLCAAVAAIVLKYLDPFKTGKLVIFQVEYTTEWKIWEIIPFIFLGAIGGVIGGIFIKYNIKWCSFRKTSFLKDWPILDAATVALVTAILSFWNPYLKADASRLISILFSQCIPTNPTSLCDPDSRVSTILWLLLASVLRLLLTIFTFGLKVPAGLFIPSLAIGASVGRVVGIFVEWITSSLSHDYPNLFPDCLSESQCVVPGVYALIGAASVLGGVTRMTVSLVVIIFELTGQLSYLIPIMIAVMVSKWVGDIITRDGIYDEHILLNNFPFLDNKTEYKFDTNALDLLKPELEFAVIELDENKHTLSSLQMFLERNKFTGFPLINNREQRVILGFISRRELKSALDHSINCQNTTSETRVAFTTKDFKSLKKEFNQGELVSFEKNSKFKIINFHHYVDEAPSTISPLTTMNVVFDMFKKMGHRYVLIADTGRLVGVVTKKDVLQHISQTMHHKTRSFLSSHKNE